MRYSNRYKVDLFSKHDDKGAESMKPSKGHLTKVNLDKNDFSKRAYNSEEISPVALVSASEMAKEITEAVAKIDDGKPSIKTSKSNASIVKPIQKAFKSNANKTHGDRQGWATAGIVLAVIGLLLFFTEYILLSVFLFLIGLIFSAIGIEEGNKGLAKFGVVLNVLGLLLLFILFVRGFSKVVGGRNA
jgi:hypothetical protein